ncbi:MAG: hypothetical protein J5705_04750 [Bacteroidaceae bacterium]|nr:hypothetical protein [Bacteroidaceae bacterium]
MEVTIIRLSRPLLLPSERTETGYNYKTIYGYVIKEPQHEVKLKIADDYTGYLAAMHLHYNGSDKDFTINNELRGVPDWEDNKGVTHTKNDAWMRRICNKAINKLNLTYTIIPMDIDEEACSWSINKWNLIVDEDFYYYLEDYTSGSKAEQPLWEEDDLPF